MNRVSTLVLILSGLLPGSLSAQESDVCLFDIDQAGIGIHAIPGGDTFSFVHKQRDWNWVVKTFDPDTGTIAPLASIPSDNENYCWTPDGVMLRAQGTRMLQFEPGTSEQWQPLTALEAPGLNKGGRCAVSPDGRYLALINERAE